MSKSKKSSYVKTVTSETRRWNIGCFGENLGKLIIKKSKTVDMIDITLELNSGPKGQVRRLDVFHDCRNRFHFQF